MRLSRALLGAVAVATFSLSVSLAQTSPELPAADIAMHGDGHAVAPCSSCHGQAGEGNAASGFPRLAGLSGAYLGSQLEAFNSGARSDAVMAPIAKALKAKQRERLAQYYAALRAPAVSVKPSAGTVDGQLALHGRWSDDIPACVNCHGDDGSGVGSRFPALAGQSSVYMQNQLRAWKAGTRTGDPLNLMRTIASRLSDEDIVRASDYFAAGGSSGTAPSVNKLVVSPTVAAPAESSDPKHKESFTPASRPIPDSEFGKVVALGRDIFENPAKYARSYVGNELTCSNCHIDAGRHVGSAPMWAAYLGYPAYRSKNHHVNTFAERLQGCFQFSMNGKAPPLGDPVLVALESYAYWMAQGAPLDPNIAGRGYPEVPKPALPADYDRGAAVYARSCSLCHGQNGEGARARNGHPAFPALWGADSFNWGAGMGSVKNAASFIQSNMPFAVGGTLSDQDTWDVALYMDSHERPQDPRYTGSVAQTRTQFHDGDDWMYGISVKGHVLGTGSVAPGPRHAGPDDKRQR